VEERKLGPYVKITVAKAERRKRGRRQNRRKKEKRLIQPKF